MKKKNYLENIPMRNSAVKSVRKNDLITLQTPNTGFFNWVAQKLFKRPPITDIDLDAFGSFVWEHIDGKKDLIQIGQDVSAKFGENAEPLYERLSRFFYILKEEKLVHYKK